MAKIHVLHENAAGAAPLLEALERHALPYRDWHLAEGLLDLSAPPPAGGFAAVGCCDVNTNTDYNSEAEAAAGISGMAVLADLLGRELAALQTPLAAAAD